MCKLLKKNAAETAFNLLKEDETLGIGTGSTVDYFIDILGKSNFRVGQIVTTSLRSRTKLENYGLKVIPVNSFNQTLSVYVDGADEIDFQMNMIKGGGGALTMEKLVGSQAIAFICIVDESKLVNQLGSFPLPIEVLSHAVNWVGSFLAKKFRVDVKQRKNFLTDHGNPILDVYGMDIKNPTLLEAELNDIPGIISNGIFSKRKADLAIVGTATGDIKCIGSMP
ncbi:MAG: ribose 5-phosphate isomerase A [Betaproteobacteria bacterium TMED82]|nr:MAG: ribose 5-phosphate isomerase A [Betaproteobacteria bacterium TMED82]|tara:strand:+ start:613 stop:1284 length:672 start_codon:yes stop_codon:yes gene_type:complete